MTDCGPSAVHIPFWMPSIPSRLQFALQKCRHRTDEDTISLHQHCLTKVHDWRWTWSFSESYWNRGASTTRLTCLTSDCDQGRSFGVGCAGHFGGCREPRNRAKELPFLACTKHTHTHTHTHTRSIRQSASFSLLLLFFPLCTGPGTHCHPQSLLLSWSRSRNR